MVRNLGVALCLGVLGLCAPLAGQDITLSGFEWLVPTQAGHVLPAWHRRAHLDPPAALEHLGTPAYSEIVAIFDEKGRGMLRRINSTHPWLSATVETSTIFE